MWKNKAQAHFRMPRRVLLLFSAFFRLFCGLLCVCLCVCVFISKLSQAQIFLSASCGIHLRFALPNSHNNNSNNKTSGKVCGCWQRVLTSVKQWKWRQRQARPGQARAGRRRRHFRLTCVLSGGGSMLCLLPQCVCVSVWSVGVNTCVGVAHWWQHLLATLPRAYFAYFFFGSFFSISPKQQHLLSCPFPPKPVLSCVWQPKWQHVEAFSIIFGPFLIKATLTNWCFLLPLSHS